MEVRWFDKSNYADIILFFSVVDDLFCLLLCTSLLEEQQSTKRLRPCCYAGDDISDCL